MPKSKPITKRTVQMFLCGLQEQVNEKPKQDYLDSGSVSRVKSKDLTEETWVYWDLLNESAFDLQKYRDYIDGAFGLIAMGRVVGALAKWGIAYMVLCDYNYQTTKRTYYVYDMRTKVIPWTGEMTRRAFQNVMQGPGTPPADLEELQDLLHVTTLADPSIKPDRWTGMMRSGTDVMTAGSIGRARGVNVGAKRDVWDYALPKEWTIPDWPF